MLTDQNANSILTKLKSVFNPKRKRREPTEREMRIVMGLLADGNYEGAAAAHKEYTRETE